MRSINLRIGYVAALFITIFAFNWTSERSLKLEAPDSFLLDEAEVKVIRTTQKSPAAKPPPSVFKVTDKILELPAIAFSPAPAVISTAQVTDSIFFEPEPGPPAKPFKLPPPVETDNPKAGIIFKIVEDMPRFPGCEDEILNKKEKETCATNRLLQFLAQNLHYPSIARENGIEGAVVISFVVETDGSISGAKVVRDIGGGCGAEALRVVNEMPVWRPGMQRGRAVRVQFNLPVRFRLD